MLDKEISISTRGKSEIAATLLELSSNGFRIRSAEYLVAGDRVTINDSGKRIAGIVKWGLGHEAGGVFLSKVDLDRFN